MSTLNDDIHDTVMNFSAILYQRMDGFYIYSEIRMPDSQDNTNYQRTFFQSSFDASRFLRGVRGNILLSGIFEPFLKTADFELRLPLPKGNYNFFNVTIPTHWVPFKSASFLAIFNATAKMGGNKRKVWIYTILTYGKLIWALKIELKYFLKLYHS